MPLVSTPVYLFCRNKHPIKDNSNFPPYSLPCFLFLIVTFNYFHLRLCHRLIHPSCTRLQQPPIKAFDPVESPQLRFKIQTTSAGITTKHSSGHHCCCCKLQRNQICTSLPNKIKILTQFQPYWNLPSQKL